MTTVERDPNEPVRPMGRLPFVGGRLLAQLRAEAERLRPSGVAHAPPGDVLSRLAVSRQLREAVSDAVGTAVVPTYEAVYQYHRPGALVSPHRDQGGYDLVFHLTLDHAGVEAGTEGSVLELLPDGTKVALPPGEGLVLRGKDVVHGWTRLGPKEHRTLIAVGFAPSDL